ncbi:MAG TPA: DUF1697 domain-containing protein [Solirubrobacterales bacterium]|jgi:uncharacterized protein (DUF1697 family)|nr:DUF1697 domain-containing protein [Solirubrobacterales bacterium]
MERYVAFLRGMNLGNRRIKNDELRAEFETLGFADVVSFRASGNVIFGLDKGQSESALAKKIEAGLAEGLGYEVPVFLRSCAEVAAIAAQQPFAAKLVAASKGKLQILLLAKKPSAAARKKVLALASDEDLLGIDGRELFWLPSGGTIDSALDLKAIDATLGKGTMRTMGTIEQIAAKHC